MLLNLNATTLNTNGLTHTDSPVPPTPTSTSSGTLGTMFSDKYASVLYWLPRTLL